MKDILKKLIHWINPPVQERTEIHEGVIQSKYRKENPPYGGTPPMLMMARSNYEKNPDSRDYFMISISGTNLHIEKRIWDEVEVGQKIKITYRFPEPRDSLMSQINSALKTKCIVEYNGKVDSF